MKARRHKHSKLDRRTLYIPALTEELARKVVRFEWPRRAIRTVTQWQCGIWEVKVA